MSLPPIFAIYRSATQTFQFLQVETVESENRLKSWTPPIKDGQKTLDELDSPTAKSWQSGAEWYVEPLSNTNPREINIYQTQINNKSVFWWSMNHTLIWSNYNVHSRRSSLGEEAWKMSPSIPIIEIAPELPYPRTTYGFYPRWVTSKAKDLDDISHFTTEHLEHHPEYFNTIIKNLKITAPTPTSDHSDDDSDSDSETEYDEVNGSTCLASLALLHLMLFTACLYVFICEQTLVD